MKARWTLQATAFVVALVTAAPVAAKVTAKEAAALGNELKPLGATRAGNESGTIPAWEGGIKEPPPGYRRGEHLVDPFPADKPLFTITADNFRKYEANLTPGQIAVLQRYPKTYRIPVYQTRRTASLPPRIYERTIANAVTAMLTDDGNGVTNAAEGIPFPIPKNGLEAIWNHMLRYRGKSARVINGQAAPTADGSYVMVQMREQVLWGYHQPGATTDNIENKLAYFMQEVLSPARLAGLIVLVHDTLNQAAEPRKAWVYSPGQRRVRRAPNVGYDNRAPVPTASAPTIRRTCTTARRTATTGSWWASRSSTSRTTATNWPATAIASTTS